jgi:hypothetical protein
LIKLIFYSFTVKAWGMVMILGLDPSACHLVGKQIWFGLDTGRVAWDTDVCRGTDEDFLGFF